MKTIRTEIAKGITEVKVLTDLRTCLDKNGNETKVYMHCNRSYTAKIDLLPLKITNLPLLDTAKHAINYLHHIRIDINCCIRAWGFGWSDYAPAVLLAFGRSRFGIIHGYEAMERKEFNSFSDALVFLEEKYGKTDFHRSLTVNENMSNNKKCYSICDWLLKR